MGGADPWLTRFGLWLSRRARAGLVTAAGWAAALLATGTCEGRTRDVLVAVIAVATVFGVHVTPNPPGMR